MYATEAPAVTSMKWRRYMPCSHHQDSIDKAVDRQFTEMEAQQNAFESKTNRYHHKSGGRVKSWIFV